MSETPDLSAFIESGFVPNDEILTRVRKLVLLGFETDEMMASITAALGENVSLEAVQQHVDYLHEVWGKRPEVQDLLSEQGRSFSRIEMFLRDLLDAYQNMLLNHRADIDGVFVHPDGRPVKPVKPLELAAMAEKISKLEIQLLTARREAVLVTGAGAQTPSYTPPLLTASSDEEMDEDIEIEVSDLV